MTAKEYLSQAYTIDKRVHAMLEQLSNLHALSTKASTTYSQIPVSSNRNVQRMEEIICKIVDLEAAINEEIDKLVDLKGDIMKTIKGLNHGTYQTLLEYRYLCFKSWEQISQDMGFDLRWIYRLHGKALQAIEKKFKARHEKSL